MTRERNDGQGGRGIVWTPNSGTYGRVVLWFHGLGDTADGWAEMMPDLAIDNTKFILPTTPMRPIALNMGMEMPGWSDIYGLEEDTKEDADGFNESAVRVNSLIQAELDKGIPANKIILAGFSQGGALAMHVALRSENKFAGLVGLSAWLPMRNEYPAALSQNAKNLPIFQVHGSADQVVSHKWGKDTHEFLKTMITSPTPQLMTIKVKLIF